MSDSGNPRWAIPCVSSAPPFSFMNALIAKRSDARTETTRPTHTSLPAATTSYLFQD
jgi:hypothetical protein